jgi:hypothetical protein
LCYRSGRQWPEAILIEQTAEHRLLVPLQSLLLTRTRSCRIFQINRHNRWVIAPIAWGIRQGARTGDYEVARRQP